MVQMCIKDKLEEIAFMTLYDSVSLLTVLVILV